MNPAKAAIRQKIIRDGGRLLNVWEQPDRGAVFSDNEEKRKRNPRKSDWIRPMAAIPELDKEVLRKKRPEIFQDSRKMERWLNSSEGRPYRTTPKGRSRNFSFGGI